MKYHAIVSAHIYRNDDGRKDVEIFNQIHNDKKHTGIFDDIDHALMEQVEPDFEQSDDYFFIAIVESEFIKQESLEGVEYDVEHDVKVIKSLEDLPKAIARQHILSDSGGRNRSKEDG